MQKDLSTRDGLRRYKYRIFGPFFILMGLMLLGFYIYDFVTSLQNYEFPQFYFLPVFSVPMIVFGIVMTVIGYRKITPRYTTDFPTSVDPASSDYRYGPTTSRYKNASEDTTRVLDVPVPKKVKCRSCGGLSNPGTTYCSHCGEKLR
ncbi:MAG: hypothetical protein NTV44_02815 [Firmicutes bacterium]|nr:hypothetical protein [Bacillota bacterium]